VGAGSVGFPRVSSINIISIWGVTTVTARIGLASGCALGSQPGFNVQCATGRCHHGHALLQGCSPLRLDDGVVARDSQHTAVGLPCPAVCAGFRVS
jgi:hypothetical protein